MLRLHSTRIITPGGTEAGTIVIRDGRIMEVEAGTGPPQGQPQPRPSDLGAAAELDFGDRWIAPGFIDTHVHGGGGAQCNTSDPDEVRAVARFHAARGTTALLATTVAAPISELESALTAISRSMSSSSGGAAVLGAHLEGPFLSPSYPGAMDSAHFLLPAEEMWERLLAVAPGTVAMMTLAPELPSALHLVTALAQAGVVVSLGHTDASYEQALDAVEAGATAVTHLFNAMRPMHHRDPGIIGAALDLPDLSCELICDGHHVAGAMLRIAKRVKGSDGVRLVTDAIEAAGMPDGEYDLGGVAVTVRHERATVSGSERLAGSTLTMQDAVRNAVWMLGITVETAVALASNNPARLLGIAARKGSIAPGLDADLVVLGDDLRVERAMVGGEFVYSCAD